MSSIDQMRNIFLTPSSSGAAICRRDGRRAAASAVASLPISQGRAAVELEVLWSRRKAWGFEQTGEDALGICAARPFQGAMATSSPIIPPRSDSRSRTCRLGAYLTFAEIGFFYPTFAAGLAHQGFVGSGVFDMIQVCLRF